MLKILQICSECLKMCECFHYFAFLLPVSILHGLKVTVDYLALFSSCLVALGVFFVAKLNVCDVFKYASSLSLKLFTTIIDAKVLSWLTV